MLCLITLLRNGASSVPEQHYIEAHSKELAFNSLVLEKGINPVHYSTILVCDLTLHIHESNVKVNQLGVKINNDFSNQLLDLVTDYDKGFFKPLDYITDTNLSTFDLYFFVRDKI